MISVKGTFKDGTAQPAERIEGREGEPVLITFLGENDSHEVPSEDSEEIERQANERELWDRLFTRKLSMGQQPLLLDLSEMSGDDFLF